MKHLKWLSLCGIVTMTVGLLALTACGGDDNDDPQPNGNNQNQNQQNNGGSGSNINTALLVGDWRTVYADVKIKDSENPGNDFEFQGDVDPSIEASWPFYNEFSFGTDGSFNGWAINYNGTGKYHGRMEQTFLGKYKNENGAKLYDLIMGYHEVRNFKRGETEGIQKQVMPITIKSLTATEFVYSIEGYGTFTMAMKAPTASLADLIVGTWGTTRIKGNRVNTSTGTEVESWDNTPKYTDYKTDKESLKYAEFVFFPNGEFERWAFNKSTRKFELEFEGTYTMNENQVTANLGEFQMTITIEKLNSNTLVFSHSSDEDGIHEEETITTVNI